MYTKEQKKEAYSKLSDKIQYFITDNETTDLISKYLEASGVTKDNSINADSEILYAMYGLHTLDQAIENINKFNPLNPKQNEVLQENLKKEIFDRIDQLIAEKNTNSRSDFNLSNDALEKINVLCGKYDVNEQKKNKLLDIIYELTIDPKIQDQLIQKLSGELEISDLKAEQIAEEINAKIIKLISQAPNTKETKNIIVPPENLPIKMEPARVETKAPTYKKEEINIPSYIPNSTPNVTVTVSSEPVQRPIPVPRFNASSDEASAPSIKPFQPVKKVETLNIIEAKLNKPTSTPNETKKQEMPTTKYSVDPYREPLE